MPPTSHTEIRAYLASLFAFLLLRVDLLLVDAYLPAAQVGYFSVAASMADLLYIIPAVVAAVMFPKLASLPSVYEKARLAGSVAKGVAIVCGVLVVAAFIGGRAAIVVMYGPAFEPASSAFVILSVAMWFYGVNGVISGLLAAVGFPAFAIWIWAVALVINVIGNVLLIPPFGIEGAAAASVLGYAVVFVAQLGYTRLRLEVPDAS